MVEFPTLDPEFVALRESLWDLRCHAEVEEVGPILDVRRLPSMQQGYVRLSLNGTHFTMNAISHMHDALPVDFVVRRMDRSTDSRLAWHSRTFGHRLVMMWWLLGQTAQMQSCCMRGPRGRKHGCLSSMHWRLFLNRISRQLTSLKPMSSQMAAVLPPLAGTPALRRGQSSCAMEMTSGHLQPGPFPGYTRVSSVRNSLQCGRSSSLVVSRLLLSGFGVIVLVLSRSVDFRT